MTARLHVTTSGLYVTARLDVARLDIGGDIRRPRDQRVIEVRHRGIRRLIGLLANGQKLFVDSASPMLRLQLRHFAGRRLRQLRMRLRLRRHQLVQLAFNACLAELLLYVFHELSEALSRILVFKGLLVQDGQVLRQGKFQHSVLLSTVSQLEVEEFLVLLQYALLKLQRFDLLFLAVAVFAHLHAIDLEAVHLLV